jgi:hypothetical protein
MPQAVGSIEAKPQLLCWELMPTNKTPKEI